MATIGDGFKDIFLAGVGAMAITGEKATDLVSTLIAKGELTVEQGKQINTELAHKAANAAQSARFDALEARMSVMTPEEREGAYQARRMLSGGNPQQATEQLISLMEKTTNNVDFFRRLKGWMAVYEKEGFTLGGKSDRG